LSVTSIPIHATRPSSADLREPAERVSNSRFVDRCRQRLVVLPSPLRVVPSTRGSGRIAPRGARRRSCLSLSAWAMVEAITDQQSTAAGHRAALESQGPFRPAGPLQCWVIPPAELPSYPRTQDSSYHHQVA
jgi:hypothetical protein